MSRIKYEQIDDCELFQRSSNKWWVVAVKGRPVAEFRHHKAAQAFFDELTNDNVFIPEP